MSNIYSRSLNTYLFKLASGGATTASFCFCCYFLQVIQEEGFLGKIVAIRLTASRF